MRVSAFSEALARTQEVLSSCGGRVISFRHLRRELHAFVIHPNSRRLSKKYSWIEMQPAPSCRDARCYFNFRYRPELSPGRT